MTTAATSLLGLALPVTGELSGTWGDTVNNSITSLLDSAVAGTTTLSADADVTLTTTTLSANQAREAIILWAASGTVTRTITAPAQSKTYVVINSSGTQSIKLVGAGPTTGVTVLAGEKAFVAWNGTDFVKVGDFSGDATFSSLTVTNALTAGGDSSFTSTGALAVSKGTTAQRPASPATSMVRYNSTTNEFEGYSGASPSWKSIGGSALSNDTSTSSNLYPVFAAATSGTAQNLYTSNAKYLYKPSTGELQASEIVASNGLFVNATSIAASYTIQTGFNAQSVGPVTIASGQSVSISSGQRWLVY